VCVFMRGSLVLPLDFLGHIAKRTGNSILINAMGQTRTLAIDNEFQIGQPDTHTDTDTTTHTPTQPSVGQQNGVLSLATSSVLQLNICAVLFVCLPTNFPSHHTAFSPSLFAVMFVIYYSGKKLNFLFSLFTAGDPKLSPMFGSPFTVRISFPAC